MFLLRWIPRWIPRWILHLTQCFACGTFLLRWIPRWILHLIHGSVATCILHTTPPCLLIQCFAYGMFLPRWILHLIHGLVATYSLHKKLGNLRSGVGVWM